jgi:CDP-glucose 4,6-dehydratase
MPALPVHVTREPSALVAPAPDFWRERPVLVTGGTGLLGSWLVRMLVDADAEVTCIVRPGSERASPIAAAWQDRVHRVYGSVCDRAVVSAALQASRAESVFHLAAQTIVGAANEAPAQTFETNVGGTWTVLEACRQQGGVRSIVLASSDKAYGSAERLPYTETAALRGRHPYDVSKSCADLIGHTYAHTYGLPVAITRCGNFYGGGDLNWSRIVPGTIRAALAGQRPVIRSDGQMIRDYFYVEDGASATLALARALHARPELTGEAFNFSNELEVTVLELTRRILRVLGSSLEPEIRNEPGSALEIRAQTLSAAKARERLGWTPRYALDEGLERTVGWYRDYLAGEARLARSRLVTVEAGQAQPPGLSPSSGCSELDGSADPARSMPAIPVTASLLGRSVVGTSGATP